jgi:hypothetical protein
MLSTLTYIMVLTHSQYKIHAIVWYDEMSVRNRMKLLHQSARPFGKPSRPLWLPKPSLQRAMERLRYSLFHTQRGDIASSSVSVLTSLLHTQPSKSSRRTTQPFSHTSEYIELTHLTRRHSFGASFGLRSW